MSANITNEPADPDEVLHHVTVANVEILHDMVLTEDQAERVKERLAQALTDAINEIRGIDLRPSRTAEDDAEDPDGEWHNLARKDMGLPPGTVRPTDRLGVADHVEEDQTDKDWWEADYRILDASGQVTSEGTEQVIAGGEEGAGYMAWCGLNGRTLDESGTGKVVIDAVRKV